MTSDRRLLDLLGEVDASDPLWDDVDLLVTQVRTLAAAKLKDRAQFILRDTLIELSSKFSAQLDYFGFNHFTHLHEQTKVLDCDFAAEIRDLIQQLDAHANFDLSASDVTQARQKRKVLDHLEAKILESFNSLESRLTLGGHDGKSSSDDQPGGADSKSSSDDQPGEAGSKSSSDEPGEAGSKSSSDEPGEAGSKSIFDAAESLSKISSDRSGSVPPIALDELLKHNNKLDKTSSSSPFIKPNRYLGPQTALSRPLSFGMTGDKPPIEEDAKTKPQAPNRHMRRAIDKSPSLAKRIRLPRTSRAFDKEQESPKPVSRALPLAVPLAIQLRTTNDGELSNEDDDNVNPNDVLDEEMNLSDAATLEAVSPGIAYGEVNTETPRVEERGRDCLSTTTALMDAPIIEQIIENGMTISVESRTGEGYLVSPSVFQDRTWRLLECDDIAGAYWSEIALQKTGWSTDCLAGLQASRWMTAGPAQFSEDLLEISQLHAHEDSSIEESLLKFAAALVPSVIAPTSGMVAWLSGVKLPPSLLQFSSDVVRFAHSGISLEPFELLRLQGSEAHKLAIQEISSRAAKWLNDAQNKTTKFWRTSRIWLRLTERGGALYEMILPVSTNDSRATRQVREALSRWEDRNFVYDQIEQIDRLRVASNASPLPGSARDQLIRFIQEACSLSLEWVGAVESANARQSDWTTQQIEDLKTTLRKWEPTLLELTEQLSRHHERDLRISGIQLGKSISHLFAVFGLRSMHSDDRAAWSRDLRNLIRAEPTLEAALCKRLLLEHCARLADDGKPLQEWLSTATFEHSPAGTLELLHAWITQQDFRFIDQVLSACEYPDAEVQLIRDLQQKDIESAKKRLRDRLIATEDLIERAVIDGLIAEERSEFLAELEQIDVDSTANFGETFEILHELENKLQTARKGRASYIAESWAQLRSEARERGLRIPENTYSLIKNSVSVGDVRVADEAMSILRLEIEAGVFSSDTTNSAQETVSLRSFWNQLPKLVEYLRPSTSLKPVIQDLRRHHLKPSVFPPDLNDDCRNRGADILDDFRQLKEEGPRCSDLKPKIVSILDWLGFNFSDDASRSVAVQKTDNANYAHLNAKMSAGQHSPVPLFGSQSANRYDLILMWNHFAPNQYATLLKELKITDRPLLVFYFGRLDQTQRILLRQESQKLDLPGLVIDEALVLFLISAENRRLQAFFECSLPFARNNPYAPFRYVPPEVFFGRQEAASALQSPAGTCLVFGGKQLGKSTLLQHVQREFNRPEMDRVLGHL